MPFKQQVIAGFKFQHGHIRLYDKYLNYMMYGHSAYHYLDGISIPESKFAIPKHLKIQTHPSVEKATGPIIKMFGLAETPALRHDPAQGIVSIKSEKYAANSTPIARLIF